MSANAAPTRGPRGGLLRPPVIKETQDLSISLYLSIHAPMLFKDSLCIYFEIYKFAQYEYVSDQDEIETSQPALINFINYGKDVPRYRVFLN